MAVDYKKFGILGAIVGASTPVVLSTISSVVSMIPGVQLNLQAVAAPQPTISIATTGVGTVVNPGLNSFVQKLLGLVPIPLVMADWIMVAVGGALFFMLGAFAADKLNMLKGEKTTQLAIVIGLASIVTGIILSMQIAIPSISAIIILALDAYILSWIWVMLAKSMKLNIIP